MFVSWHWSISPCCVCCFMGVVVFLSVRCMGVTVDGLHVHLGLCYQLPSVDVSIATVSVLLVHLIVHRPWQIGWSIHYLLRLQHCNWHFHADSEVVLYDFIICVIWEFMGLSTTYLASSQVCCYKTETHRYSPSELCCNAIYLPVCRHNSCVPETRVNWQIKHKLRQLMRFYTNSKIFTDISFVGETSSS